MDKLMLLCIWLAAGMILICGVVVLHLRRGAPLHIRVKGLGVEINLDSGRDPQRKKSTLDGGT